MKSMTGFGAARGQVEGFDVLVDIKSVNQKNLEVRVQMNRAWSWLEARALKVIKSRIKRGRLTLTLQIEPIAGTTNRLVHIDEQRFLALAAQLQHLAKGAGLPHGPTLADLLVYRKAFELQEDDLVVDRPEQFDALLHQALEHFDQSRAQEGARIKGMLQGHLRFLEGAIAQAEALRPGWLEGYHDRMTERLSALADSHGVTLDQERIIHEVILFGDRTDIAEEVQRAGSHVAKLQEIVAAPGPHGKPLDFYLQEMIRETNTMASKSHFSPLTDLVVQMKTAVEQMREQTANLE